MSTRYSAISPLQSRVSTKAIRKLQQRRAKGLASDRVTPKDSGIRRVSYGPDVIVTEACERVEHSSAIKKPKWLKSDLKARNLMRSCEVTLRPEDSIERAARIMCKADNCAIPVVDAEGCLIGIIAPSDITIRLIAAGASVPHTQVSDCMTAEVFACSADNSLESCVSALCWHQVKQLPIVDDEHRVLGTISQRDLAEYLFEHAKGVKATEMIDILWALTS